MTTDVITVGTTVVVHVAGEEVCRVENVHETRLKGCNLMLFDESGCPVGLVVDVSEGLRGRYSEGRYSEGG